MSSKPELWDIKFVKLEILQEKIAGYAAEGYESIGFLWWDISIHPKIFEIISCARDEGFTSINVISNGMKFDDPLFARKFVESWVTRVNFSIHSYIPQVEEYLIQVPWGLERKWQAIDNLQELHRQGLLKDALSINYVVNKKNYETVGEAAIFYAFQKSVRDIRYNFMWLNDDMREYWDDLAITYSDFIPYIKKLIYISEKYDIRITFDTIPACVFYAIDKKNGRELTRKYLWEDHDHIVEVDHINAGDEFNWKKRKKDILKTQFPHCKKCIYRDACQWVWKWYVEQFWEKEFQDIFTPIIL